MKAIKIREGIKILETVALWLMCSMSRQQGEARSGFLCPGQAGAGAEQGLIGWVAALLLSILVNCKPHPTLSAQTSKLGHEDGEHCTCHTIPQLASDLGWPSTQSCS